MKKIQNTNQPNKPKNTFDHEKAKRNAAYTAKAIYSPEQRFEAGDWLKRKARQNFTASEYMLIDFIFDRTITWGKAWETITLHHFTTGSLEDGNGNQAFCGTGLSERCIRDTLKSAERKGIVVRRDAKRLGGYVEYALRIPCLPDPLPAAPPAKSAGDPGKICRPESTQSNPQRTSLRSERKAQAGGEREEEEKAAPAAQPSVRKRRRPQREEHLSRYPRIRHDIEDNEENREVLDYGRELADAQAEGATERSAGAFLASGATLTRPEPGTPASGPQNGAGAPAMTQGKRVPPSVRELQRDWAKGVKDATGCAVTGWTQQECSQVADMVRRVPMPDPGMNWKAVLHWIATRWGEANGLARPAAFRHDENVHRIIKAEPRIYHVLRHAEDYLKAYAALFYGEGVPFRHKHEADELQAIYEQIGARMRLQSQVGVDHLPSALLSRSELDDKVTDAALRKEARAIESRKRRDEYRERLRAMRQKVGFSEEDPDKARRMLDSEIAAHRVREGWDDEALSQFVTATPGYYDEDEA